MIERWRPVRGFDGYDVSDAGRVRSWKLPGKAKRHRTVPVLRKLVPIKRGGYLTVTLSRRGHKLTLKYVHHLVLEAFVGPKPHNQECCHKDRNVRNNRLRNIRWDTHLENVADQMRHGTDTRSWRNGQANFTQQQVHTVRRRLRRGERGRDLAREFHVSESCISNIKNNHHYRVAC